MRWLLVCLVLVGCGDDARRPDAGADAGPDAGASDASSDSGPDASLAAMSCAELSSAFGTTLDAIANTCVNDNDCVRVGAPPLEPMCGCSVGIIVGCGSGANQVAYTASAAPSLAAEFARRCAGAPGLTLTCACGNYVAHCGSDGSCVAEEATACLP